MHLNYKIIFYFFGLLLLFNGGFMMISTLISFIYKDGVTLQLFLAGFVTLLMGTFAMLGTKNHRKEMNKREGYIVVAFGWVVMSLTGTLPYLLTDAIPSFTNAFFETMSGYTTTGASILNDIEVVPKGVLFWRSTTHWIGGMGIIVLAIAILPLLGVGGMQLFAAEAPGPGGDKLHPRITDTAKRLWLIYVGYTAAETILLQVAGMSFFDAINHALSTLSTGGFSTKNASVAHWNNNPAIQYIIIFFMFLAGTNFVLSYYMFKGNVVKIIKDDEFKLYFRFIAIFTVVAALLIYFNADVSKSSIDHPMVLGEGESAFRHALFQILAIITTTGFVSADYTLWTPFLTVFFFGLMFLGGSAGSTSGGVKVMRHLILIKNGFLEFKRALHPNAILKVRYNNKSVSGDIVFNILGFF
ncbi:TrkH family potassium uptake protein, partial [Winogradskyella sp.]|nr:TrkH family potassium uptake protein [Winogradskyella sp.]